MQSSTVLFRDVYNIMQNLEVENKLMKDRKSYLHESCHLHALKRDKVSSGCFMNTKKFQESEFTSENHGVHVLNYTQLNLIGYMLESKVHVFNYSHFRKP